MYNYYEFYTYIKTFYCAVYIFTNAGLKLCTTFYCAVYMYMGCYLLNLFIYMEVYMEVYYKWKYQSYICNWSKQIGQVFLEIFSQLYCLFIFWESSVLRQFFSVIVDNTFSLDANVILFGSFTA